MGEETKRKYKYTGYNPKNAKYVNEYKRKHMKLIQVSFNKEYYEETVEPILNSLGISASAFIRMAVENEVKRIQGERND